MSLLPRPFRLMLSNLHFIVSRGHLLTTRLTAYTAATIWGIIAFLGPTIPGHEVAAILSQHSNIIIKLLGKTLPLILFIYGLGSIIVMLMKYDSRKIRVISGVIGATLWPVVLAIEVIVHHSQGYSVSAAIIANAPYWIIIAMSWWIFMRDTNLIGINRRQIKNYALMGLYKDGE